MAHVSKDQWKVTSTMKMCRSNFRIKVDLCKFYSDVRRFCWIFVDGTKMLRIADAVEHITKLFNIKEPFHLLLNETEYLPPAEDIRVLKENETILVCPGTGLEGETELPLIATSTVQEAQDSLAKAEITSNLVLHKESQTNFYSVQPEPSVVEKNELLEALNRSQNDTLETSSTLYDRTEDEMNSTSDSKADGQILSVLNIDNSSCPKRKRRRTRRKKKTEEEVVKPEKNEVVARKPKIINTFVISTSKHIRFDNSDHSETVAKKITPNEKMNGSYSNEVTPTHELANLLSLGDNSTPVTFENSQVKQEIKLEHTSDEENRLEDNNKKNDLLKQLQEGRKLASKDLEACPALITKPELKYTLAFKMLKIGLDYTPQVSDFIVAKVISYCPNTLLYTFKVLYGLSEVQVPVGKFTLIEDDGEQTINDTITINIAQLIEPRIVSTTDSDKI